MAAYTIPQIKEKITPIAREHGVKSVYIFGSYARGTADEMSDIDLLIERGRVRTLFQLSGFRLAVEKEMNLNIDLVTTGISDKDFLDNIQREQVLIYES